MTNIKSVCTFRPFKTLAILLMLPTLVFLTGCPKNANLDPTPTPSPLDNVDFDGDKFVTPTPSPSPSPSATPIIDGNTTRSENIPLFLELGVTTLGDITVTGSVPGITASYLVTFPPEVSLSDVTSDSGIVTYIGNKLSWSGPLPVVISFNLLSNTQGVYTYTTAFESSTRSGTTISDETIAVIASQGVFVLSGPVAIVTDSPEDYTIRVTTEPFLGSNASFEMAVPAEFSITNLTPDDGSITFVGNTIAWSGSTPANLGFTILVNTPGVYPLEPTVQPGGGVLDFELVVTEAPSPTPTPTPVPAPEFTVVTNNPTFVVDANGILTVSLSNAGLSAEAVMSITFPAAINIVSVSGAGSNVIEGNSITWTVTPGVDAEVLDIEVTSSIAGTYEVALVGSPGDISGSSSIVVTE